MKIKFLAFIMLLFMYSTAHSQTLNAGIKFGANLNKLTGKSFNDQFSFGYHAGAFINVGLGKKWSVQPELLFSQTNVDTSDHFSSVYQNINFNMVNHVKLNYLSIPVLLQYKLSPMLAIQAGPQFGILMQTDKSLLRVLAGLQLKFTRFIAYGRYAIGVNNISNVPVQDSWKNQTIQIGVGYVIL
jgi:hypothetical protein